MKIIFLFALTLFLFIVTPCKADSQSDEIPSIREFDIETIEKLGKMIYEQDMYAANATDILFEKMGKPEKFVEEKRLGWIVVEKKDNVVVRFIKQVDEGFAPAYDITFSSPKNGILTKATGDLSPDELARFKARQVAAGSIHEFCSPSYNTVVLPDVDGKGFLVYLLAATTDTNAVVIGGHYRVTVSEDGATVERVDKLSRACLTIEKHSDTKELVATHLVSNSPVETHVFLSLLHNQPFMIATPPDAQIWKIYEGKIYKLNEDRNRWIHP